jgi:hypothetical protein
MSFTSVFVAHFWGVILFTNTLMNCTAVMTFKSSHSYFFSFSKYQNKMYIHSFAGGHPVVLTKEENFVVAWLLVM